MQFQPKRFGLTDISQKDWFARIDSLVKNGLRAQLSTGNLLTGSLIVKLVNKPELTGQSVDFKAKPYPDLPTIESNVEAVTADVETLIKNLSELPLDSLISEATQVLQEGRQLLANPDLAQLPGQLSDSMQSINDASANLPAMIQTLTTASENANEVLEGLSPDSRIYIELSEAASELSNAARSIADFAELLEENPRAVLLGR